MNIKINYKVGNVIHSFSHYKMNISLFNCEITNKCTELNSTINASKWISRNEIDKYAFHKANHKLFELIDKSNV